MSPEERLNEARLLVLRRGDATVAYERADKAFSEIAWAMEGVGPGPQLDALSRTLMDRARDWSDAWKALKVLNARLNAAVVMLAAVEVEW